MGSMLLAGSQKKKQTLKIKCSHPLGSQQSLRLLWPGCAAHWGWGREGRMQEMGYQHDNMAAPSAPCH